MSAVINYASNWKYSTYRPINESKNTEIIKYGTFAAY